MFEWERVVHATGNATTCPSVDAGAAALKVRHAALLELQKMVSIANAPMQTSAILCVRDHDAS